MTPRRNLRLEAVLSARIGAMRCAGCRKPLGNTPRRISRGRHYHPACAPKEE